MNSSAGAIPARKSTRNAPPEPLDQPDPVQGPLPRAPGLPGGFAFPGGRRGGVEGPGETAAPPGPGAGLQVAGAGGPDVLQQKAGRFPEGGGRHRSLRDDDHPRAPAGEVPVEHGFHKVHLDAFHLPGGRAQHAETALRIRVGDERDGREREGRKVEQPDHRLPFPSESFERPSLTLRRCSQAQALDPFPEIPDARPQFLFGDSWRPAPGRPPPGEGQFLDGCGGSWPLPCGSGGAASSL